VYKRNSLHITVEGETMTLYTKQTHTTNWGSGEKDDERSKDGIKAR